MLNSKQRAKLRSLAQNIDAITQVGKLGVNDALIDGLDLAIEKRELIKITILENSGLDIREAGEEIADRLNAELVCVCGRKAIFYRRSNKNVNHIEF